MISAILIGLVAIASAAPSGTEFIENQQLEKRLNNGLGKTPILGWNGWVRYPMRSRYTKLISFFLFSRTKDSAMPHQRQQLLIQQRHLSA